MSLRQALLPFVAVGIALSTPSSAVRAQSTVDVIRGTILGSDKKPIEGAVVTATSISLNIPRPARTDKDGKFTISFPDGGGDYWISLAAIGYVGKRFELKRNADEEILLVDETMAKAATTLNAVRVTADRQRPRRDDNVDVSGSQRAIDMSSLALDQMGDLSAMTAMLPGFSFIPGADGSPSGFSVLGLDASQNSYLVNGVDAGSGSLPRDATISVQVFTNPFDVSLGRFSGAQLGGRFGAGSNYVFRPGSATLDAPPLQFTDAVGRAGGQQYSLGSIGGSFSGPIKLDKIFYSTSYEVDHRFNDLHTLANTDPVALQAAGVAADSVARLLTLASGDGIPQSLGSIPGSNITNTARATATFDFNPPSPTSGQSYNLSFSGGWSNSAPGVGATSLATRGADRTSWNGTITGRHTDYFGFLLSETNVGITESRSFSDPYLEMPGGSVRVNSTFADGTSGVAILGFGGGATYSSSAITSYSATNLLRWFSSDNKHLLKLKTEVYQDQFSSNSFANQYGTFSFNSLADVQAGTPASFTRSLTPRVQDVGQSAFGESLGDSWRPIPDVQVVYGVRMDGNRLNSHPDENPQVDQTFGLHNSYVPNKLYWSPRVGFSWVYGTAPTIGAFAG
ncbi:MAG TPA: carboxypeptidase regulatory-like domain-containing protein, partial [Gemmatimonadaceae bacterium]|nr:carboxypeptidase regulatory-like domain-containing protein [Gemmatimonadaceae bacterium]